MHFSINTYKYTLKRYSFLLLSSFLLLPTITIAQQAPDPVAEAATVQNNLNIIWTVIAACLVFFMQAGFTLVETGLTRAKNAVNIIMKNVMDISAGGIAFFLVGFGLMFGTNPSGWIGTDGFALIQIGDQSEVWGYVFFFFQAVFAATAATIVSGAVAERTAFSGYLLFSIIITAFVYPIFGSWAWGSLFNGSGWLENLGFIDFAGSTVVHSIGGWAALAGALIVGPRMGKYKDGKPQPIQGHSLPLAALGIFILWLGWFGFNAGSTTTGDGSVAKIIVNTFLAGGAGALAAMTMSWVRKGKPDGAMTMNGVLAGLVGITAGCADLNPAGALAAGLCAGVILYLSSGFLERFVDDAVGAVSVHGVCGAWGTIAVALFHPNGLDLTLLGVQSLGVLVAFAWTFPLCYGLFSLINVFIPLRVNGELEEAGLDLHEHDAQAYPEFSFAKQTTS